MLRELSLRGPGLDDKSGSRTPGSVVRPAAIGGGIR